MSRTRLLGSAGESSASECYAGHRVPRPRLILSRPAAPAAAGGRAGRAAAVPLSGLRGGSPVPGPGLAGEPGRACRPEPDSEAAADSDSASAQAAGRLGVRLKRQVLWDPGGRWPRPGPDRRSDCPSTETRRAPVTGTVRVTGPAPGPAPPRSAWHSGWQAPTRSRYGAAEPGAARRRPGRSTGKAWLSSLEAAA